MLLCRGLILGSVTTWESQNDGLLDGSSLDGPLASLSDVGLFFDLGRMGGGTRGTGATVSFCGSCSGRRPNLWRASSLTTCASLQCLSLYEESDNRRAWSGVFTETAAGIFLGLGATTGGAALQVKEGCESDLLDSCFGSCTGAGRCFSKSMV